MTQEHEHEHDKADEHDKAGEDPGREGGDSTTRNSYGGPIDPQHPDQPVGKQASDEPAMHPEGIGGQDDPMGHHVEPPQSDDPQHPKPDHQDQGEDPEARLGRSRGQGGGEGTDDK